MPELPEVEVLVRHLAPLVKNKTIRGVTVRRAAVLEPTSPPDFIAALMGAKLGALTRRGKYLLFAFRPAGSRENSLLVGHLGMTGRIYLAKKGEAHPRHAAVVLDLGRTEMIYEDTRYFGRLTLDTTALARLGPEPDAAEFTPEYLSQALRRSRQAVKIKLLDQSLVVGVGNIYASEALFRARISPRLSAAKLTAAQAKQLWRAIRHTLAAAIQRGSTLPLDFAGRSAKGAKDSLFYYGASARPGPYQGERLQVYDRAGEPCINCTTPIRRIVQAARSSFYCPECQRK